VEDLGTQTLDELVAALQDPEAMQKNLQYLETGVLNVCDALDKALKNRGRVAESSSDEGRMTDQFVGTRK
jgi:hypothetical protein